MDIWTLRPNWGEPYVVTYTYLTEIITSRAGNEQRRALRQTPRRMIEYTVLVSGIRWRSLMRNFAFNQTRPLNLPDITAGVRAISPIVGDSAEVDIMPSWAVTDADVILVYNDLVERRTIATAADGNITFSEGEGVWPTGTIIAPSLEVRLQPEQEAQLVVSTAATATLQFNVDPGSELVGDVGEPEAMFNDREVFVGNPNWVDDRDLTFIQPLEVLDFDRGRISTFRAVSYGSQILAADYIAKTAAEATRLIQFFKRAKGQRGEFYCPTDFEDVVLAEPTSTEFLLMNGEDFANAYSADPVYKALSFRMSNGDRFYRNVVELTAGEGQSVIELDEAVESELTPDNVVISWLPVMRNATDELAVEWLTDQVAQIRFTYKTLPAEPAEILE